MAHLKGQPFTGTKINGLLYRDVLLVLNPFPHDVQPREASESRVVNTILPIAPKSDNGFP